MIDCFHLFNSFISFFLAIGSKVYGDKSLTWETSLTCLLHTSLCLPEDKSFDIMTLVRIILFVFQYSDIFL